MLPQELGFCFVRSGPSSTFLSFDVKILALGEKNSPVFDPGEAPVAPEAAAVDLAKDLTSKWSPNLREVGRE